MLLIYLKSNVECVTLDVLNGSSCALSPSERHWTSPRLTKERLSYPPIHISQLPFLMGPSFHVWALIHTVIGNVKSDLDVGPAEASLADWYWACGSRLVLI